MADRRYASAECGRRANRRATGARRRPDGALPDRPCAPGPPARRRRPATGPRRPPDAPPGRPSDRGVPARRARPNARSPDQRRGDGTHDRRAAPHAPGSRRSSAATRPDGASARRPPPPPVRTAPGSRTRPSGRLSNSAQNRTTRAATAPRRVDRRLPDGRRSGPAPREPRRNRRNGTAAPSGGRRWATARAAVPRRPGTGGWSPPIHRSDESAGCSGPAARGCAAPPPFPAPDGAPPRRMPPPPWRSARRRRRRPRR